jgi:hypothetical protein
MSWVYAVKSDDDQNQKIRYSKENFENRILKINASPLRFENQQFTILLKLKNPYPVYAVKSDDDKKPRSPLTY